MSISLRFSSYHRVNKLPGLYIQLMLDAEIITVCSETTTAHKESMRAEHTIFGTERNKWL